jgi:hypothetical protein
VKRVISNYIITAGSGITRAQDMEPLGHRQLRHDIILLGHSKTRYSLDMHGNNKFLYRLAEIFAKSVFNFGVRKTSESMNNVKIMQIYLR